MSATVPPVRVRRPEWWWFADPAEVLEWFPDPYDGDTKKRRLAPNDPAWAAIADVVAAVGRALARGNYSRDPDYPLDVFVTINMAALDPADQEIARSWFDYSQHAVSGDVWDPGPTNGLHRLWSTSTAATEGLLLPVWSTTLRAKENADAQILGYVKAGAEVGLEKMTQAQAERSPQYVKELRRAASGDFTDLP